MPTSDTLRSVIDAGRSSKRLDELSSARVIGKIALQTHAAQQKAGQGKAVGPVTPAHIKLAQSGEATLELDDTSSLGYLSPEQASGSAGDRRSDVFSLGTVLWEALTYTRLFDAMNEAAVRVAVQERDILPPSEINANVPAELSAICMRALSRNPTDRYQSAKAMAVEIEEFLEEAGYEDSDAKIAHYLATMHEPPKQLKIAMAPLARPATSTPAPPIAEKAGGTQPPPSVLKQPAAPAPAAPAAAAAAPTILGEPPKQDARPKSPSGAALAAALANATSPNGSNGSTSAGAASPTQVGLPPASYAATAVGVPKLDDWQDSAPQSHAPPPAAAPVVQVDPAAPTSVASSAGSGAVQMTPQPPVLPSSSTPSRNDRSTIIAGSVPIPKATVDAKHVESKQPALIVEDKPKALIVDTPPPGALDEPAAEAAKPAALVVDTPPPGALDKPAAVAADAAKPALLGDTPPPGVLETMTTLVDAKPPEIVVPKLVDGRLPAAVSPSAAETLPVSAAAIAAVDASEAAAAARAPSQSDATPGAQVRAKSPHPASVVALGPGPGSKDSKDVLAGWGWGTDKHEALAPDGYAGDDDYEFHPPNQKKTLMYVIGGGLALAAVVTIIAVGFGSSPKKASTAAKTEDLSQPAIDRGAPPPEPAPAPAPPSESGSATQAATAPSDPTNVDPTNSQPAPADPAQLEAQKPEQANAELAKQEAASAELAKQEAAKAEAARLAAEQANAKEQEVAKQEAARLAADAKKQELAKQEAAKQESARLAAEKKAEQQRLADAKKAEQQRLADAKKAEAAKKAELAKAEKARKAEAAKTAKAAPTTKTTPKTTRASTTTKTEPVRTASADSTKADAEIAYRIGLQLFARGDTHGALSSLRRSLAGNPNYAPTWRGLGLVFEKMGEKDQARAAFKRYLQLAPGAGDADQIRSRLERLGS